MLVALLVLGAAAPARAALVVTATSPATNASNVSAFATIRVDFAQPVLTSSFVASDFSVFGKSGGIVRGTFSFSNANRTVTFTPTRSLHAGDTVSVSLSENLRAADGTTLRTQGHAFNFSVRAAPATRTFTQIASMSNRTTPSARTYLYGANHVDLNDDGYPDLTTVNEISADLRVFLNRADGTGLYAPYLLPPFPVGGDSSPNEARDFNRDGRPDIAVTSIATDSVWVALGNGNGTFGNWQQVPVGSYPRGIASLDADGDGDMDLATSTCAGNHVALLLNNGSGVFGNPIPVESGGQCEHGLAAADMNNDHIVDLVVGSRDDGRVIVLRGNGDATFTPLAAQSSGGSTQVIATGDLNGDGNIDVTTANVGQGGGAVLLGTGAGAFAPPVLYPTGGSTTSTDLGDLDGDGDLDWILSIYGTARWRVFTNDGAGTFQETQEIPADAAPSCSIILDFDRDGDLDLALTDELADTIRLLRNGNAPPVARVPAATSLSMVGLFATLSLAGMVCLRSRRTDRRAPRRA